MLTGRVPAINEPVNTFVLIDLINAHSIRVVGESYLIAHKHRSIVV